MKRRRKRRVQPVRKARPKEERSNCTAIIHKDNWIVYEYEDKKRSLSVVINRAKGTLEMKNVPMPPDLLQIIYDGLEFRKLKKFVGIKDEPPF